MSKIDLASGNANVFAISRALRSSGFSPMNTFSVHAVVDELAKGHGLTAGGCVEESVSYFFQLVLEIKLIVN